MHIGDVRVKIAYVGQQQVCDLCDAPGHIARNCPYRDKCFQCGQEGHFSRNCPETNYRDRDSVLDGSDPTPAEAAGRAVPAADAAAADAATAVTGAVVPSESTDVLPCPDADSLDGSSALDASTTGTSLDVDLDLSDSEPTPTVGSTPDVRDNQLNELVSQPLFPPSAPSSEDVDSLQGATVDSAASPASLSSPGQGPSRSAPSVGLLGKLKSKVGLNKKKDPKVTDNDNGSDIDSNAKSSLSSEMSTSVINTKTSTSNGNNNASDISHDTKICISNGKSNSASDINNNAKSSNVSDISSAKTSVSPQNLSESDYIGQGVLAGPENNSDMVLEVESQKRSHPDSDSVDSVDDGSFATPVAPPPRASKKKPAVVVSPGTSRPAAVDRDRSRSRSPKRLSSAHRPHSAGTHAVPPSIGYVPKPPRSSSGSRGSKPR